jgi:hypothetical protein
MQYQTIPATHRACASMSSKHTSFHALRKTHRVDGANPSARSGRGGHTRTEHAFLYRRRIPTGPPLDHAIMSNQYFERHSLLPSTPDSSVVRILRDTPKSPASLGPRCLDATRKPVHRESRNAARETVVCLCFARGQRKSREVAYPGNPGPLAMATRARRGGARLGGGCRILAARQRGGMRIRGSRGLEPPHFQQRTHACTRTRLARVDE